MFRMDATGHEEGCEVSLVPYLPAEISESYAEPLGQISLTVMPTAILASGDRWETVVDLSVDQATILRDALSMLIDHLNRNPASKSRIIPEQEKAK